MTVKTGVLYLQKDKLQLYSPLLGSIVEFRFVPEVVRDLDIVNKVLLENLIKVFVTNGKIPPSNLVILLSDNTYYIKDFTIPAAPVPAKTPGAPVPAEPPKVTMEILQKEADTFVEHVPYDNVVSKKFPMKNGMRICAANKDFFDAIRGAFEKLGFTVESVIPGMVLGNNLSTKPVMDGALATVVLQRASSLKQYDLLVQEAYSPSTEKEEETHEETDDSQNKKPSKKRMFALLGVLATLLIVLIIVFVQSQQPPTPPQQPVQANSPAAVKPASTVNTVQPTVLPTLILTPTPATVVAKDFAVQIVNTPESVALAQTLRTQLTKYNFKSITPQTQTSITSASTLVIFSTAVGQDVRNKVLEEVRKVKTDITVQERQPGTVDISIIIGR